MISMIAPAAAARAARASASRHFSQTMYAFISRRRLCNIADSHADDIFRLRLVYWLRAGHTFSLPIFHFRHWFLRYMADWLILPDWLITLARADNIAYDGQKIRQQPRAADAADSAASELSRRGLLHWIMIFSSPGQ
jgi:hypothetical protein